MAEISTEIQEFEVEVEAQTPLTATVENEQMQVSDDDPNAAYQYELMSCLSRLDNNTYGLQAIKNAFAALQTALQGNDTTATLTALKQAIAAIGEAGLTDDDKVWLTNKFNSITIDTTTLAKEATLGTHSDTSASNTIFGKIANLLSTLTTWINGAWTNFVSTAATKSDIPTDYAKETNATSNKQAIIDAMPSVADLATEVNATANRTALANAIAALQGNNTDATLTAIYTIVGAITSGLTDADKTWLQTQFAAIDLSAITSRLDNSTYGLNALKTAISSITFDKSDLAKESTLGTANDTAANATIFGKLANLLSTWNTWISGAWATLVSNVSSIKTSTDKIGTNATGQAATLFGALAQVSPAQVEAGVTRIQQRLGVAESYTADVIPTATAESKAQEQLRAVHGAVSGEQSTTNYKLYGVVRVKHAASDTDSNSELASLNRNLVYGGATKDKSWQSGGQVVTTKVPDTGYGFTEFWLKNGDSWIHYTSSLPSQQDNINTLHPALHTTTTDGQGNIVRTPTHIISLTNPS